MVSLTARFEVVLLDVTLPALERPGKLTAATNLDPAPEPGRRPILRQCRITGSYNAHLPQIGTCGLAELSASVARGW